MSTKRVGMRRNKSGENLFIRMDPRLVAAARKASWERFGQLRLYMGYLVAKDVGLTKIAQELQAQGKELIQGNASET